MIARKNPYFRIFGPLPIMNGKVAYDGKGSGHILIEDWEQDKAILQAISSKQRHA